MEFHFNHTDKIKTWADKMVSHYGDTGSLAWLIWTHFRVPTAIYINSKRIQPRDWMGTRIQQGDVVEFIGSPETLKPHDLTPFKSEPKAWFHMIACNNRIRKFGKEAMEAYQEIVAWYS